MTSSNNVENKSEIKFLKVLRSILLRTAAVVLVLFIFIWAASPSISYQLINDYLDENHGLSLSEETHIQYNPFLSRLNISDLKILKGDTQTLNIDQLTLEIQLFRLLTDGLFISQFKVDGFYVDIKMGEPLTIAGLELTSKEIELVDQDIQVLKETEQKSNYQLIMPLAVVKNGIINLHSQDKIPFEHQLKINQLKLSKLTASEQQQKLRLNFDGTIDDAKINLNSSAEINDGLGIVESQLSLSHYSFKSIAAHLPNTITDFTGSMDVDTKLTVNLNEDDIVLSIPTTHLSFRALKLTSNSITLNSKNFEVDLAGLNFQSNNLAIDKVSVKDFDAEVTQLAESTEEENAKTIIAIIKNEEQSVVKGIKNDKQSPQDPLKFKLNKLTFIDNAVIQFNDNNVEPTFNQNINISQLWIKKIDNQSKKQISQFAMSATISKYTKLDLSGDIQIFSDKKNVNAKVILKEFSLPEVNQYLARSMGFQFESGSLDTELDLKIKDSMIDGSTTINIRALELTSKEKYNENKVSSTTSMPLNIALSILKDDDNHLELEIPIKGDISSPSFGLGSFVSIITQKAIKTAATTYLINTFVPYANIVNLTLSASDFILSTKFEDLEYQANQDNVSEDKKIFIQQFIKLLKDKNELQVKACAFANQQDLSASKKTFKRNQDKISYLKSLAKRRMEHFKENVVSKDIESSRILLCSPNVDLADKKPPRIEFSL